MSKYEALGRYLKESPQSKITMPFGLIDDLVSGLPPSARKYHAWWSNKWSGRQVQSRAWTRAGWRVHAVDLTAERVTFTKSFGVR